MWVGWIWTPDPCKQWAVVAIPRQLHFLIQHLCWVRPASFHEPWEILFFAHLSSSQLCFTQGLDHWDPHPPTMHSAHCCIPPRAYQSLPLLCSLGTSLTILAIDLWINKDTWHTGRVHLVFLSIWDWDLQVLQSDKLQGIDLWTETSEMESRMSGGSKVELGGHWGS